jgi:signal transduction histidine kinase
MISRFRFGAVTASKVPNGDGARTRANGDLPSPPETRVSRRELRQLKWLTALVPGTVVLIYESARQEALEHVLPALPVQYGNLVVWVLVLVLTYAFATFVFSIVERLQAQAMARSRDLATLSAVVEERARLSRELHDGFAQLVAFLLVRIDTVEGLVTANRDAEAMVELEHMRSVTDDLYQDVRESISELRTRVSERGLPAAVREYVDAYEDRHAVRVHLEGEDVADALPALVAFQLLRIIQEALANVRKHARARNTWIQFRTVNGTRLQMIVADDGQGFEPESILDAVGSRKSFGLTSMRERAESLDGELQLDARPGGGTRVIVSIPFKGGTGGIARGLLAPAAR